MTSLDTTLVDIPRRPASVTPSITYPQDWPAYNAAQTSEKENFMELLAGLCSNIEQTLRLRSPSSALGGYGLRWGPKGLLRVLVPPFRVRHRGSGPE